MKLFDATQRRALAQLLPLLLIFLLLLIVAELLRGPKLIEKQPAQCVEFQSFDPNTFEYEQLREAGLPVDVAVGIVRWRNYGKRYRIKEDLALVSGMTDSLYQLLKPYIIIADSLAPKARVYERTFNEESKPLLSPRKSTVNKSVIPTRFSIDTVSASYLTVWGLSLRQAEAFLRYREACGGIFSVEHLSRCYVVDKEFVERVEPYIVFSTEATVQSSSSLSMQSEKRGDQGLIEINSADSATLVRISGIGPKSAAQIIKYRELLGGYYNVDQISELEVVTEENFQRILPQICCDSAEIKKININFASPKLLERHPYLSNRMLRRIINKRELKGGWSTIREMIEDDIFSEEEAARIAPYLDFSIPQE
jgi:competence ComEA-like helix-hairpin-helix protein